MTEPEKRRPDVSDLPGQADGPKTPDEIKADIEATRAQLAETADALSAKLDVKAQAGDKVHEAGQKIGDSYEQAKHAAPEPVQQVLGKVEQAAAPAVAKAGEDKKRTTLIALGVVAAVVVALRVRKARAAR